MEKADARKKEQDEITAEKEAEEAVGEFEDFQIMSIEDTDKFIIWFSNDIRALRPMPFFGTPSI